MEEKIKIDDLFKMYDQFGFYVDMDLYKLYDWVCLKKEGEDND